MKKSISFCSLLVMLFMIGNFAFSQVNPNDPEYQRMKAQGLITQPAQVTPVEPIPTILPTETGGRDIGLFVPRDGAFIGPMSGCDDCSYGEFALPFTFCFYGTNYTSFWLNNNGNVSFTTPYGTYSPSGFPSSSFIMLAPFWADVVTWDGSCGLEIGDLYYKIESTRVIVIWENVGYYGCGSDKRNTFELIFTNSTDPLIGVGNNVAFSYADMQWTTGDASDGVGGFGGFPATVGVNKGDGVKYALVGRFDHAGTDYDGPGGANDGVSYLDGKYYTFNACSEDVVIPGEVPVANWALYIGIFLILTFTVVRFRKMI
jgi:hypothetical protein